MQASQDAMPNADPPPYLDARSSRLPEYAYQAAILVAILLLLWTVA